MPYAAFKAGKFQIATEDVEAALSAAGPEATLELLPPNVDPPPSVLDSMKYLREHKLEVYLDVEQTMTLKAAHKALYRFFRDLPDGGTAYSTPAKMATLLLDVDGGDDKVTAYLSLGKKTARWRAFHEEPRAFLRVLFESCKRLLAQPKKITVHLNRASDVPWEAICPGLFSAYPTIDFVDDTEIAMRMTPPNYTVVLKYNGRNLAAIKAELARQDIPMRVNVVRFTALEELKRDGDAVVEGEDLDGQIIFPA